MENQILSVPVHKDGNLVSVCAWCFPGKTLFDKYPYLTKEKWLITHGICQPHCKVMAEQIKAAKFVAKDFYGKSDF